MLAFTMDALEAIDRIDRLGSEQRRLLQPRLDPTLYFSDEEFKNRYRMTKILLVKFEEIVSPYMVESKKIWGLSKREKLLITLRFYATGSIQSVLSDFHGVHKSTISRVIHGTTNDICNLRSQMIRRFDAISTTQSAFYGRTGFPEVTGCVDGSQIKISRPSVDNADDFLNRKGFYSINCQFACDDQMRIIDVVARWPGSVHDARIFENSVLKFDMENSPTPGVLLGDNGYPCRRYIMTPLLNPMTRQQKLFNVRHKRTRITVERLFGILKRRFLCLHFGLRFSPERCCRVIIATSIIHNFILLFKDDESDSDVESEPNESEMEQSSPHIIDESIGSRIRQNFIDRHF